MFFSLTGIRRDNGLILRWHCRRRCCLRVVDLWAIRISILIPIVACHVRNGLLSRVVVGLNNMVVSHSSISRCGIGCLCRGGSSCCSVNTRLLQFRLHCHLRNRHGWLWRCVNKGRRWQTDLCTRRHAIRLRCILLHRNVIHPGIRVECMRLLRPRHRLGCLLRDRMGCLLRDRMVII